MPESIPYPKGEGEEDPTKFESIVTDREAAAQPEAEQPGTMENLAKRGGKLLPIAGALALLGSLELPAAAEGKNMAVEMLKYRQGVGMAAKAEILLASGDAITNAQGEMVGADGEPKVFYNPNKTWGEASNNASLKARFAEEHDLVKAGNAEAADFKKDIDQICGDKGKAAKIEAQIDLLDKESVGGTYVSTGEQDENGKAIKVSIEKATYGQTEATVMDKVVKPLSGTMVSMDRGKLNSATKRIFEHIKALYGRGITKVMRSQEMSQTAQK